MRRIRLSTLMLLIVIAALAVTVVMQQVRAARREAELRAAQNHAVAMSRFLRPSPTSEEIWDSFLKQHRQEAERRAKSAKPAEAQQKPK
jgi:hypothetical protein